MWLQGLRRVVCSGFDLLIVGADRLNQRIAPRHGEEAQLSDHRTGRNWRHCC
jgi:hypothetical protein